MAGTRPNILLIMSDEHDRAIAGCYGDRLVRTPNLDRLAASGITFDNCYTPSPLCVPARLSFTAGQYISRFGGWNNATRLPRDDYPSLPRLLTAAGYDAVLGGKMHFDAEHRYGFQDLAPDFNDHYQTGQGRWRDPGDTAVNDAAWFQRSARFLVGDDSSILRHDEKVQAVCSTFLKGRSAADRPFFLLAGFLAPHFPLIVPPEFAAPYAGRVPPPDLPTGLIEHLPRNYQHLRRGFGVEAAPAEQQQLGRDLYWGLVAWFDREVGRLLTSLHSNPAIADNTIVVYTSDHGENKGDHGLWWKNNLYEHSAGVPLIVSWPAQYAGGQRRSGACSLLDLVQTIAGWAGAKTPAAWDGDSLGAVLENPAAPWKDQALSEYYGHNICSGMTMLRQGRYKYIYHNSAGAGYPAERELFDVVADPGEIHNLAAEAAGAPAIEQRLKQMHTAMVAELREDPETINARCILQCAAGYGRPPRAATSLSAEG